MRLEKREHARTLSVLPMVTLLITETLYTEPHAKPAVSSMLNPEPRRTYCLIEMLECISNCDASDTYEPTLAIPRSESVEPSCTLSITLRLEDMRLRKLGSPLPRMDRHEPMTR